MFGFDPITMALIGGALGGLTNKRDPLTGALLGAGMGGVGGLLGGAGAGAGAAAAAPAGGVAGGTGLTLGAAAPGLQAAGATGLAAPVGALAQAPGQAIAQKSMFDTVTGMMKPIGDAYSIAQKTNGLLGSDDRPPVVQPSPFSPGSGGGPQGLTQLVGQQQQTASDRMRRDLEDRLRRQEMIARIGGGNGLIG